MRIEQFMKSLVPYYIQKKIRIQRDLKQLSEVQRSECNSNKLRPIDNIFLDDIFISNEVDALWLDAKKEIDKFDIPDGTGGGQSGR